jgi:hypothetical protein
MSGRWRRLVRRAYRLSHDAVRARSASRWAAGATLAAGLVGFGPALPAVADQPPESFEHGPGLPAGWTVAQYRAAASAVAVVAGGGADGAHHLTITSPTPNHARVVVPAALAAGTTYRFRASARAAGVADGAGAVLGVEGRPDASAPVRTDEAWHVVDLYVRADAPMTASLTLGLGNFGTLTAGRADFDAVSVTPAGAVPAGVVPVVLAAAPGPTPAPATAAELPALRGPSPLLWWFTGVLAVALAVGAGLLRRRTGDSRG